MKMTIRLLMISVLSVTPLEHLQPLAHITMYPFGCQDFRERCVLSQYQIVTKPVLSLCLTQAI